MIGRMNGKKAKMLRKVLKAKMPKEFPKDAMRAYYRVMKKKI